MQLIRSIEISYFRSLHRVRIAGCRPLNVFCGLNDSGKSNVLKALGLFFNQEADWSTALDFHRDFCAQRLDEVRKESVKGKQFIRVSLELQRPATYKNSLPEQVRVAKTWYRDRSQAEQKDDLEKAQRGGKLPSTLETARRCLQMLLNRTRFEYVPAVKDRRFFEHILGRLQTTLLGRNNPQLSQMTEELAGLIQERVTSLQEDFRRATGIQSMIVPPDELSALFQAFGVSTDLSEEYKVPLGLRGDGIQALYVLSMLRFISESSNLYFLWGFEEPENSLEYSLLTTMARELDATYSKVAQIFVTTHSPALTTLRSDRTACFRVSRDERGLSVVKPVWPEGGSALERAQLNVEMGFMHIQEELHGEYVSKVEEVDRLREGLDKIQNEIAALTSPVILTEGKNDASIIRVAWEKRRPGVGIPFQCRSCDPSESGSSGGVTMLRWAVEAAHPEYGRKVIGIFDRDSAGIKEFGKLSANFSAWRGRDDVKVHSNSLSYAFLLPVPTGREAYARNHNMPLEYLFPDEVLKKRTLLDQGLQFGMPALELRAGATQIPLDPALIPLESLEGTRSVSGGKTVFAEQIVPGLDAAYFEGFASLLSLVDDLIWE